MDLTHIYTYNCILLKRKFEKIRKREEKLKEEEETMMEGQQVMKKENEKDEDWGNEEKRINVLGKASKTNKKSNWNFPIGVSTHLPTLPIEKIKNQKNHQHFLL